MTIHQRILQRVVVARLPPRQPLVQPRLVRRQHDGRDGAEHVVRRRPLDAEAITHQVAPGQRQVPVVRANRIPPALDHALERAQGRGHAQRRCVVVRPDVIEIDLKLRPARPAQHRVVGEHHGAEPLLPIAPNVQERCALGRAQPLVTVGRVADRVERSDIHLDHPGRVGAVHDHVDPARLQFAHQPTHRENERGGARDVADEAHAGLFGHARHDRVRRLVRRAEGKGQLCAHDRGAPAACDCIGVVLARKIFMRVDQHLVAGLDSQVHQRDRHARRRVGHEHQVARLAPDQRRQIRASRVQSGCQTLDEEPHRLGFHASAPLGLHVQHVRRARAVRTMIQEAHPRVQPPA